MTEHNEGLQRQIEQFSWAIETLPIRYFGDAVLRTVCEPVSSQEFGLPELQSIANELSNTLATYRSKTGVGRGLAANQIGHTKRMVAVLFADEPQIICNPEVISSIGRGSYWESCISSGALLVGEVHRPWQATFRYQDLSGHPHQLEADEKQTRVLLHEIDHLNGILCSDHYQLKTMKFVTGGSTELLNYTFTRLDDASA